MGRAIFPPCYLTWGQNYGGGNEDNGDLLQKVPCRNCYTQCLQPWSRPPSSHASVGDSWTHMGMSGSVSCGVTAPFSWVLVHTSFCLCPPRVCFLVLCKFWWLCGGVNDDLLQEEYGLCHTQVCCTQSPCLCSSPLLTHTATSEVAQSCLTLYDSMNSSLHQAPPSMGFSRQEYWSGLPFPFPGDLPNPGIEYMSLPCRHILYC